nr:hypothetical protein [Tanacetum cinerariifolium]
MNIALALMAKAFKLNYSTPTNNNQRISSNPMNRQIAQPGMNIGQDKQIQMVGGNGGNQFRLYAGQNAGILNGYNAVQNVENQVAQNPRVQNVGNQNGLIGVQGNENQNQIGNDNLVAQASSSGTQTDSTPVYNLDGSAEYTELLEPIPEPQQVPQNDYNAISEVTDVEQDGETVEQHSANFEKTHTDEEVDEQELEAHYSYMAKIQEVSTADSGTDSEPVEQNDQNDVESDDERVALANLIANLKLDVDENKKIQKQLKKANTTLSQELKECKTILAETSKSLGKFISV